LLRRPSDHHRNILASSQSARPAIGGIQDQHHMTVFEATPQSEPAYRQNRFVSGDNCMRAQNTIRTPMELKNPARQRQAVKMRHFWASVSAPCRQLKSRREHHHRSDPRRKTPNLHSLE
jgi:hypothetical protein